MSDNGQSATNEIIERIQSMIESKTRLRDDHLKQAREYDKEIQQLQLILNPQSIEPVKPSRRRAAPKQDEPKHEETAPAPAEAVKAQ